MDTSPVSLELLAPGCDAKEVLISGSFNEWITSSGVVRLSRVGPGYYRGEASWPRGVVRYKYHLGDWDHEELDAWGSRRTADRVLEVGGEALTVRDEVPQFLRDGLYYRAELLPRIEPLPGNLPLPAPFATRRIAALLPADYDRGARRYPVLYLQDGQNLFDEFAPYGNWELDKRLAWLAERGLGDFIVVAIDHGADKRIAEYAPPRKTRVARGQADAYAAFLADHLKPLIDRTYRTFPGRSNTAVGGSRMGALASLYVAMTRGDTFGAAMLLSPSIWVDPEMPDRWPREQVGDTRVFLAGGMLESKGSAATFARLADDIAAASTRRRRVYLRTHFEPTGRHAEADWGRVFPRAAAYLFGR